MSVENLSINSITLNYDFSQFIEVVEFVNEKEPLLINILKINHKLKGILFGNAEYIETIRNSLDDNLRQRCEFIKGDIFTSIIPAGYQLYILKNIFDTIDQNLAINFLSRCYQATEINTRFLIIEKDKTDLQEIPDSEYRIKKIQDRYRDIFKQANFIITNIINSGSDTDIIEVLRM